MNIGGSNSSILAVVLTLKVTLSERQTKGTNYKTVLKQNPPYNSPAQCICLVEANLSVSAGYSDHLFLTEKFLPTFFGQNQK